ncbi:MAG: hypothetical protein Q7V57_19800 [Actinomycetota bacterium]|nr:hypothetical protein [Actinomycetota bacterium]
MRTRTLLLLAVTCGLAILLAGGIQLLRLANQETTEALGVGDRGTAGDAVVVVNSIAEADGVIVVTVTLSGVVDASGLNAFTLVGVPKPVDLIAGGADACTGFTIEAVTCTLSFPTDEFTTRDRQLLFIRAEEQVRWRLV